MNISFIAKFLAPVSILTTASIGISYGFGFGPFALKKSILSGKTTSFFVVSETLSESGKSTGSLVTGENQNYQCQIGNNALKVDLDCEVREFTTSSHTQKQLSALSNINVSTSEATDTNLQASGNLFKVEIKNELFDDITWSDDQKINIFKKDSSTSKFAVLKPLFAKNGNNVFAKTLYSVGKVSKFQNADGQEVTTLSENKINKPTNATCLFTKDQKGSPCSINVFASSDVTNLSSSTFSWSTNTSSEIKKDNYYVFKHTTVGDKKLISDFLSNNNSSIITTVDVNVSENEATVKKIKITDLTPVAVIEESGKNFVFLLR